MRVYCDDFLYMKNNDDDYHVDDNDYYHVYKFEKVRVYLWTSDGNGDNHKDKSVHDEHYDNADDVDDDVGDSVISYDRWDDVVDWDGLFHNNDGYFDKKG